MKNTQQSNFDRFIQKCKNHPVIASILLIISVVILLANFTNALSDLRTLIIGKRDFTNNSEFGDEQAANRILAKTDLPDLENSKSANSESVIYDPVATRSDEQAAKPILTKTDLPDLGNSKSANTESVIHDAAAAEPSVLLPEFILGGPTKEPTKVIREETAAEVLAVLTANDGSWNDVLEARFADLFYGRHTREAGWVGTLSSHPKIMDEEWHVFLTEPMTRTMIVFVTRDPRTGDIREGDVVRIHGWLKSATSLWVVVEDTAYEE